MGLCVSVEEDDTHGPVRVAPAKSAADSKAGDSKHEPVAGAGASEEDVGLTGVRADGSSVAMEAFETAPDAKGSQLAHLDWMQGEWKNPWPKPPLLMDDAERCRVVDSYKIVDTDAEAVFDRLCDLANTMLKAPFSAVDILSSDKHFFKSISTQLVLPEDIARERGFPREASCCNYVLKLKKPIVISDLASDSVFEANPIYTTLGFRFYASAPLINDDGVVIGTMCVLSPEPRTDFTTKDVKRFAQIADTAMKQIELRKQEVLAAEAKSKESESRASATS